MPRRPRFAPPGYYLHITQRGNYRQPTFHADRDRHLFLDLLARHSATRNVDVLAYCLMPNHYHLLARANEVNAIPRLMQAVNGQYATYLHGRLVRSGRLWQNRYYSCVLQHTHLLAALRYVELNPVRARIVDNPFRYPWSSATAHTPESWLDHDTFKRLVTPQDWPQILATAQTRHETAARRHATNFERAFGTPEFTETLESEFRVQIQPRRIGRPPTSTIRASEPTPPHAPVSSKRPPQSAPCLPAARVTSSA